MKADEQAGLHAVEQAGVQDGEQAGVHAVEHLAYLQPNTLADRQAKV
jgi:hypothetical protein